MTLTPETLRQEADEAGIAASREKQLFDRAYHEGWADALRDIARRMEEEAAASRIDAALFAKPGGPRV